MSRGMNTAVRPEPLRCALLRGRDYTTLGQLAAVELPGGGGLALTRGALPKAYAHVDPNEDGALVLDTQHGTLIAVVDGHHGRVASDLALDALREAGLDLLRDDDDAFRHAVEAVVARVVDQLRRSVDSRTCLSVATVVEQRCRWANFGDSCLLRASALPAVSLANHFVLQRNLALAPDSARHWWGRFDLRPGERVAAMTDGVTNFVYDPERLRALLEAARGDLEAARDIASAAMLAGAGDNVAVATCTARTNGAAADHAQRG